MCKGVKQRVQMSIPPDSRLAGAIDNRSPSRAADNPRDENNNGDKVKDKVVCFTPATVSVLLAIQQRLGGMQSWRRIELTD